MWQRVHNQRAQQERARSFTPRPREGARNTNASPETCGPRPHPQGGIKIMEGRETWLPQGDAASSKGKGKVMASSGASSSWQ